MSDSLFLNKMKTLLDPLKHLIDKKAQDVDWNENDSIGKGYIKNRPFFDSRKYTTTVSTVSEINWDGNTDGLEYVDLSNGQGYNYYLISDATPAPENVIGGSFTIFGQGTADITSDMIMVLSDIAYATSDQLMLFILTDNYDLEGIIIPKKGIYTITPELTKGKYVSNLTFSSPVEATTTVTTGKLVKIPSKFLPNTVALKTDLSPVATTGDYNDLSNKPIIYQNVVRYDATQSLTDTQKSKAKTNIGINSAFDGTYTSLTDKPTIIATEKTTVTLELERDATYSGDHFKWNGFDYYKVSDEAPLYEDVNSVLGTWYANGTISTQTTKTNGTNCYYAGSSIVITVAGSCTLSGITFTAPSAGIYFKKSSDTYYQTALELIYKADLINKKYLPSLATVATTGSYNDLTDKPTISSITSINGVAPGTDGTVVVPKIYSSTSGDNVTCSYNNVIIGRNGTNGVTVTSSSGSNQNASIKLSHYNGGTSTTDTLYLYSDGEINSSKKVIKFGYNTSTAHILRYVKDPEQDFDAANKAYVDSIATTAANAASKPKITTVTLSASSWTNDTQSVTVQGILADSATQLITCAPVATAENLEAITYGGVYCTGQAENSLTFTAITEVPEIDVQFNVTFMEAEAV